MLYWKLLRLMCRVTLCINYELDALHAPIYWWEVFGFGRKLGCKLAIHMYALAPACPACQACTEWLLPVNGLTLSGDNPRKWHTAYVRVVPGSNSDIPTNSGEWAMMQWRHWRGVCV